MATIDEVATFLASACSRTAGTDLFMGQMPSAPDDCMAIYEYPGQGPEMVFGSSAIALEYPRVQIVCRGAALDYTTPRATAEVAYRALAAAGAQSISATRYLAMVPLQAPFLLSKDPQNRIVIAFNAQLVKELSAA